MRNFCAPPVLILAGIAAGAALGASAPSAGSSRDRYVVIDLGLYGPAAINDRHQVAMREQLRNTSTPAGDMLSSHPFAALWHSGTMLALARDEEYTAAAGLNNLGRVVGYGPASPCAGCPATTEARLWHADGIAETLPGLFESQPAASGAEAHAINDKDEIVGWAFRYVSRGLWQRAMRWRHGQAEALGADGSGSSAAFAINELGDAVGWVEFESTGELLAPQRAALWSADARSTTNLGALGGTQARSVAHDINTAREIVGASDTVAGNPSTTPGAGRRAFLWKRGAMTALGTLEGHPDSEAFAVNARGEIVGTSYKHLCGPCRPRAVRWIAGGVVDLNSEIPPDSGWHLMEATDVNDDGCIVGRGLLNGQSRYFLLVPRDAQHAKGY